MMSCKRKAAFLRINPDACIQLHIKFIHKNTPPPIEILGEVFLWIINIFQVNQCI